VRIFVLPSLCRCIADTWTWQLLVCAVVLRRIAKLLLFCSLVPESVPPLPACGTAAYVRRLWRHPDAPDTTCEVCAAKKHRIPYGLCICVKL
jgi:hypothetical protein